TGFPGWSVRKLRLPSCSSPLENLEARVACPLKYASMRASQREPRSHVLTGLAFSSMKSLISLIRRAGFLAGVFVAVSSAYSFPIITSVVETGGDNEATDTIVAKWTGTSFTVSIANEPIPGAVIGNTY